MSDDGHISDRLSACLAGALTDPEAGEVRAHLSSCAACAQERDLLREGLQVMPALPAPEPRPGFAGRVAAQAAELHPRPVGAPWWRWAFGGGLAAAGLAAALVVAMRPNSVIPRDDVLVAQRLDLYDDLNVVQNQDALEDLDVVEVLHVLQEGKP
jgi:anti-sigma factor RsiW